MSIQEKALSNALKTLNALNVSYKVIGMDGAEYGNLEVVKKKARTRRHGIFSQTGYHLQIDALKVGEAAKFTPPAGTTAKEMQKPVSSRANKTFGSGNFMSSITNGQVEILRLA